MDEKLISEAVKALQLIDIHLYSTSVQRFEEISSESYPENMSQQNKIAINADFFEPEGEINNNRLINAKVEFGLRFIVKDGEKITTLAEIETCFIAKYHQEKEVSDEAINEFMKFNVVHNVWPFWREHAFRLSAESKLPTPIISLYKGCSILK